MAWTPNTIFNNDIGAKVIKLCPAIFAENPSLIYNNAIEIGKYPMALKVAKVIALFKKGDKYLPNNYCPISLLSCFNKIFEKLLSKRLVKFLYSFYIYRSFSLSYFICNFICTFVVNCFPSFRVSPPQTWVASWIWKLSGHQLDEPMGFSGGLEQQ